MIPRLCKRIESRILTNGKVENLKVSFFIGGLTRGGAERVISILANDYSRCGWDVDVVLLLKNEVHYTLEQGIRVVDLTQSNGSYVRNALPWLVAIRRYLKQRKPERVVSFVGRINALVLTAAMGLKLPIVVSERNDPRHDNRGAAMLRYCNLIYRNAKTIVFQNQYEKSCFDKALESRSCVIPNPVAVAAVCQGERPPVVVTAGRLMPQKNQAMLIRAMARVHQVYPQVKCRIYGEGTLRESLQAQIGELNLQDVVTLEGNVSDIHERLAQCGIFALTSNYEGLSNALIEAMMVGLPCITTDYPGARELITHEETGLVVPMDDDTALAQEIIKLIENKENYAAAIAQKGQAYAARFRAETVLKQWHSVIEG